jgi:hypothetical protein
VELTVQGRERVTLQKTHTLPESELAPFHHTQGVSHKEHHEYLVKYPKPAVRDLVKERDWRLRNGHTSPSRTVTVVTDVTRVETVFSERRVVMDLTEVHTTRDSGGRHCEETAASFSAAIPPTAPSSFYVAGGNWSVGKGYLAEIVYTVSVCVVGETSAVMNGQSRRDTGNPPQHDTGATATLAPGEVVLASAKRHFLVNQQNTAQTGYTQTGSMHGPQGPQVSQVQTMNSSHALSATYATPGGATSTSTPSGPNARASRAFLTGGETRATVSLSSASVAPGDDSLVVRTEVNCSSSTPATCTTIHVTCALAMTSGSETFTKKFDVAPHFANGFPGGYFGERFHLYRTPPGWPASTAGVSVRCTYGVRVTLALPGPSRNLTLDVPLTVKSTASMYSSARPAGAPWTGGDEFLSPVFSTPVGVLYRPPWADDRASPACFGCATQFTLFNRKHHCRHCGFVFCKKCSPNNVFLPKLGFTTPQRVCLGCHNAAYRSGGVFQPTPESEAYAAVQTAAGVRRNAQMHGGGSGVSGGGLGGGGGGYAESPPVNGVVPRRGELREVTGGAASSGTPQASTHEPTVPVQDLRQFMQGPGGGGTAGTEFNAE